MTSTATNWFSRAVRSAVFAALTAIIAKLGLEGIDSDVATLVRTVVILVVLAAFVVTAGKWDNPLAPPAHGWLFLVLSRLATGACRVRHFRAPKVAPVGKLRAVPVALFAFAPLGVRPTPRASGSASRQSGFGVVVPALK